jgi:hypothetical protein
MSALPIPSFRQRRILGVAPATRLRMSRVQRRRIWRRRYLKGAPW